MQLEGNQITAYKNGVALHSWSVSGGSMGAKLYFYEQGASMQVVGSEAAGSSTLLMKLKAGSNTFQYDASYWTDSSVLNENLGASVSDSDDQDVKMSAFNTLSISALTLCYKTLDNCYIYDLGGTYASAQSLFSSGFIRSLNLGGGTATNAAAKQAWTDLFLPPGTPPGTTTTGTGTEAAIAICSGRESILSAMITIGPALGTA
jgi:hypothetical protein